jgi:hypothetical protein
VWAVRTSQETHHVSAIESNRLMLFGGTAAVSCENRTEHTDTLWAVRTSQETHHVSTSEPSRLLLFEETVAVCCYDAVVPCTYLSKTYGGSGCIDPHFLDLGNSWI